MMAMKKRNVRSRRILVVDDDPDNLKIVSCVLAEAGFNVETSETGEGGIQKMDEWDPHLVLLDVNMPGLSGLETLAKLREKEDYVAVILVSANTQNHDIIEGLDAGADDYICKPYDPRILLARVRAQLRIKDLHDELRRANNKLQDLVDIDDLTGLYNMRSIYQRLDKALHEGRLNKLSVCVIMMDMDHFKRVNDNHDHLFGSFVLAEVGKLIKRNLRRADFAARYGGDEFLVVLTNIDFEGAHLIAARLKAAVATHHFVSGKDEIDLTTSLGFALSKPGDTDVDSRTLVRVADRALYDAKDRGRDCIFYYDLDKVPVPGVQHDEERWHGAKDLKKKRKKTKKQNKAS